MRAGKLRHRVELQQVSTTANQFSEGIESWSTFATVWAEVMPLGGRELTEAQTVHGDVTHKVLIRHGQGVTPKHRIKWGSRYLEITSVLDTDERSREEVLMCIERVV